MSQHTLVRNYVRLLLEKNYVKGSTFTYKDKEYNVSDLIEIMKDHDKYPIKERSVTALVKRNREEDTWTWEGELTFGDYIDHYERSLEADFSFPIIISPTGSILDGNHRLLKAYLKNKDKIKVQYCHDIGKKSCKLKEKK